MEATRGLQLALDQTALGTALDLVSELDPLLTRVEVGTPLLLNAGRRAVETIRRLKPEATLIADTKICDAGLKIATSAYAAGASAVTVVASVSDDRTWSGIVQAAAAAAGSIIVDAMRTPNPPDRLTDWLKEAAAEGVRTEVCIHRAAPPATGRPDDQYAWTDLFPSVDRRAIAGNISADEATRCFSNGFGVLVVGSAIAGATDPLGEWQALIAAAQRAQTELEQRRNAPA